MPPVASAGTVDPGVILGRTPHSLDSEGHPPGFAPFPVPTNIILTPFDQAIESSEWPLVRYADDLLILLKEPGAGAAVSRIETHLAELGLGLNAAKTRPASCEEGFHFLGGERRLAT